MSEGVRRVLDDLGLSYGTVGETANEPRMVRPWRTIAVATFAVLALVVAAFSPERIRSGLVLVAIATFWGIVLFGARQNRRSPGGDDFSGRKR